MLPIRLAPGADVRRALEEVLEDQGLEAAFVVAGIGSLAVASLRYAGRIDVHRYDGPWEILNLSGSLSSVGAHLHMSIADAQGKVIGGHVAYGNTVRTTAEVLVAPLPDWSFTREHDAATGFDELVVRRRGA